MFTCSHCKELTNVRIVFAYNSYCPKCFERLTDIDILKEMANDWSCMMCDKHLSPFDHRIPIYAQYYGCTNQTVMKIVCESCYIKWFVPKKEPEYISMGPSIMESSIALQKWQKYIEERLLKSLMIPSDFLNPKDK
jgi:hypothetical protein